MEAVSTLKARLMQLPRVDLAHLPTPLERVEVLSKKLGRFNLLMKRDDQTGLAFGGNKARKLEFILADALGQGADTVVTWGGVQSNWCCQVAAGAVRLGIKPVFVLLRGAASPTGADGNLLLDRLFGADIRIVEAGAIENMMELGSVRHIVEPVVDELRAAGKKPYLAPIGGSLVEGSMNQPLGAVAYVNAFVELFDQARAIGVDVDSVVMATGSGSTQAGLLAGTRLVSPKTRIIGVTVYASREKMTQYVRSVAEQTLALFGADAILRDEDIIVFEEYLRDGYGVFNEDVGAAMRLVAESEGVLLDPVYTGKAMAGMLDLMEKGYFANGENIVFLHSGGTPALFPYREQIVESLG